MNKIKILVIEDNRVLRDSITAMLNGQADMYVTAAMGSDPGGLLKAGQAKPGLVLLGMGLRDFKDSSVLESVRKNLPEAKVIGMGFVPAQSDVVRFVQAGASGFILKDATAKEFPETIRSVARGEKILPPSLAGSLFTHVMEHALGKKNGHAAHAVQMTNREDEVIEQICNGLSNKEIALHLNIATDTVKSHVHNIMEKSALHTRLQIAKSTYEENS